MGKDRKPSRPRRRAKFFINVDLEVEAIGAELAIIIYTLAPEDDVPDEQTTVSGKLVRAQSRTLALHERTFRKLAQ